MTKEQLWNNAKKGKTSWLVNHHNKEIVPILTVDQVRERYFTYNGGYMCYYTRLRDIYDTEAQAEFALKYYATKTIEFRPPVWDSLKRKLTKIKKSQDELDIIIVHQFWCAKDIFSVYFVKSEDEFSIEITNECDEERCQTFELSEEGYNNAISWAKSLFLEEEV